MPIAAGSSPSLEMNVSPAPIRCDQQEYNQEDGNANAWLFLDDAWPYEGRGHQLALTTLTFNVDNGEIFDVDIEINSFQFTITVGDDGVQADLQSVATHEAGHFFGLSHSNVQGATMRPQYSEGDTSLRSLESDDIAGICCALPRRPRSRRLPEHAHSASWVLGRLRLAARGRRRLQDDARQAGVHRARRTRSACSCSVRSCFAHAEPFHSPGVVNSELLVVAGEPSGDAMAAPVVEALASARVRSGRRGAPTRAGRARRRRERARCDGIRQCARSLARAAQAKPADLARRSRGGGRAWRCSSATASSIPGSAAGSGGAAVGC